ncbi:aldolase [Mariniphaga sediminis]|uniref:Aldolase n=1 Tax=Mariniphaga sediminis TaxID=1628158 RepID=A0A399CZG7_9BACT|nr:aldolase/citrate lyase family protein [Mariniphaga sediminis]RIH64543.1 aldolase [Mariniphaga sediminis]
MEKGLLSALKQGKTVYGTSITSHAPLWTKTVEGAALDFVFIDTEHIPLERSDVARMCQTYSAMGITPVVRIASANPVLASQILDAGAKGVLAPYIETIQQVKELTGAVKYRPLKGKQLQKILDDPDSPEPELMNYIRNFNRGNVCILNIESIPAVENLENLIAVPGVDAVFIGPHDLSVNMGLPEEYDHPEFEKRVKYIIRTCRQGNVAVGIHFSESPDRQIKWLKEGINIVIHSSDIALFSQKLKQDLNQIRAFNGQKSVDDPGSVII